MARESPRQISVEITKRYTIWVYLIENDPSNLESAAESPVIQNTYYYLHFLKFGFGASDSLIKCRLKLTSGLAGLIRIIIVILLHN